MPQYLYKSLGAFSTQVAIVSTAATPVVTITSTVIDVQRRLTFATTTGADFSGLSVTIKGTQDGGNTITETISGSTATNTPATATLQDFLTVTSISVSSVPNQPLYFQTNSNGGTSWVPVNTCVTPTNIGFNLTYSSTTTPLTGWIEYSYDNPPGQGTQNTLSSFSHPYPIVSTALSTAANTATAGVCQLPIACWRMTITSTSTAATTTTSSLKVYLAAIQTGLGSAL